MHVRNFPLHDAFQAVLGSSQSGFLVKLAPDGTVVYSSYFGGAQGYSSVNGVATDPSGNLFVTGTTCSTDFPATLGLSVTTVNAKGAHSGAFITKMNSAGLQIIYSALITGSAFPDCLGNCGLMGLTTAGVGIVIDGAGNALLTGNTTTANLPVTAGGLSGYGTFVAKGYRG
jgi:hypothetical protein